MRNAVLKYAGYLAILMILAVMAHGVISSRGVYLDFANFYDAGHKALLGEFGGLYDPFALIGGEDPLGHMTFFSAPVTAYVYVPLALFPPYIATFLFKLAGTLAEAVGLYLLYRQAQPLAGPSANDQAAFLGLFALGALLFQPFWVFYAVGGQTTPFVFLFLVLAWRTYLRDQWVATAILVSAVVLIKPAFAPVAVLLFIFSSTSFRLVALLCGVLCGVASIWLVGWPVHREFLALLAAEAGSASPPWMNSNPYSWIESLFVAPDAYRGSFALPAVVRWMTSLLRLATAAALVLLLLKQMRSGIAHAASRHAVFATAMVLVVVLSPVVWSHYLVVLFLPLVVLFAMRRNLAGGARTVLLVGVIAAIGQNFILLQHLVARFGTSERSWVVAFAMMKSLPAILIVAVMILFHRQLVAVLRDAAWMSLSKRQPPT